ncbi:MAG: hypothetical protein H8D67_16810 [Deltaproteobacteria bacterium]|nr:hypothetical protein [Deltaproteobacteria bacterium]
MAISTTLLTTIGTFLTELIAKIVEKLQINLKLIALGKEKQKRKDAEADVEILKKDQAIDNAGDVDRATLRNRLRREGK